MQAIEGMADIRYHEYMFAPPRNMYSLFVENTYEQTFSGMPGFYHFRHLLKIIIICARVLITLATQHLKCIEIILRY